VVVQVLLLATGESTKLQPITNTVPMPLLPIANRPLLLYPLELLARQNQKQFFVALYEQAGHIESYFGSGERWGVQLHYLLQRNLLGNGGAVKQATAVLTDDLLLVVPGDAIIDFDLSELTAFHQERGAMATVLVHPQGHSDDCKVAVDQIGRVSINRGRQTEGQTMYDTGLYLLSPQVFSFIPARKHCDIHNHLLPLLLTQALPVFAYEISGYWNTLSAFTAYKAVQSSLLEIEDDNHRQPLLKP
jgi:mannose-1-phosphate guanylyltransferase/phosphomannomutase